MVEVVLGIPGIQKKGHYLGICLTDMVPPHHSFVATNIIVPFGWEVFESQYSQEGGRSAEMGPVT